MGNSPGMMIDPNGEKTKYADPVTGDAIVDYGGMDAVTLRAYLASFRNGNFNGMYGLNTLLTEAGGGGGGTYQQARTLYFNVLAFFEEALNRNVISSYQLDFGGDDTYMYVEYYESRTETAISDEDGDVLEGVTLVDKKKTYIVPISSYLSDLHFEHNKGQQQNGGSDNSSSFIFAGDKFETQMARNDVARGTLDAEVYQKAYNRYGDVSSNLFMGFGLSGVMVAAKTGTNGLKTFGSLTEKFGEGYKSVVVAQGKHLPVELGQKLNAR